MSRLHRSFVAGIVVFSLLLGISLSFVQAQSGKTVGATRPEHIILISVDGMPPDYYTAPEKLGLKVPTLTMMKNAGAYAEGVEGVYPTVTYPQHTTMVTGLRPADHGIIQNRIFEAPTETQTRFWYWYANALKAETLWTSAKKAKQTTAAVGWPVTVGAEIDYNVPEIYEPGETPATWKWTAKHSTPGLLEKAFASHGGYDAMQSRNVDERLTVVSEYIIKNHRPNLMLIHLIELDGTHHRNGPRTKPGLEMAEREDAYIARIVEATKQAGTFEKTTFFVVSDHGFASIEKRYAPNVALAKEGLITLDASGKATAWKAAAWPAGGSCAIMLKNPNDKDTEAKVIALFSSLAKSKDSPIKLISSRAELRKMKAVPHAALMLEAAEGYSFDEALTGPEVRDSGDTYKGTHGYLPTDPRMRASLIVYGQKVRNGAKVSLAHMIDLAPTIANLLNLELPKVEGKPLKTLIQ